MRVQRATKADYDQIVANLPEFWGERDLSTLHHPILLHELGDTAFVCRDGDTVIGYLFGFWSQTSSVAYVHLIATRQSHRRHGVARRLYEHFEALARAQGAAGVKAITRPTNSGSVAFHSSLGMSVREQPDYAGPGEPRVVFYRDLSGG